jgi:hypothetical protein
LPKNEKDQDAEKGASEIEHNKPKRNVGLQDQLGHRDQDPLIKDADSDFPEPGANPEHSGEEEKSALGSRFLLTCILPRLE